MPYLLSAALNLKDMGQDRELYDLEYRSDETAYWTLIHRAICGQ